MTTPSKDNVEQAFKELQVSLTPLMVTVLSLHMAESLTLGFLELEVEEALKRPLTEAERAYCREEYQRKRVWDWLIMLSEIDAQRSRNEEVIRRIIWRRGVDGPGSGQSQT